MKLGEMEQMLQTTQRELRSAQDANIRLERDLQEHAAQKQDQVNVAVSLTSIMNFFFSHIHNVL